ncbi:biotin transporter BioY [Candidatus Pelagibacter sp.]|nr:biotin transporter BioY [Candidatus Pelagibacter sp.]
MELIKQNTQSQIIKSLIVIFIGSIILTLSAKVKIPFYPVPMTMQTFVVLFLGIGFGYKIAISTITLYLLEGILGLPVFSNSPERGVGIVYFTGPTMGYLIGFIFAGCLASFVKTKDNFLIVFIKLIFAVSTIYILGILWLGNIIGWDKNIVQLGVKPFLLAELFKIALLTILTKHIFKFRKFI